MTKEVELLSPGCLKELYNISNYTVEPDSGSTIAFASFLGQSASYADLADFEKLFSLPSRDSSVTALLNGGADNQDPGTELDDEANLDVPIITGLVDGLPVGEHIMAGAQKHIPNEVSLIESLYPTYEPFLRYLEYLLSQPNSELPYVISISYLEPENAVPRKYARRVCNKIGMLGLRGRTIVVASGDKRCWNHVRRQQRCKSTRIRALLSRHLSLPCNGRRHSKP